VIINRIKKTNGGKNLNVKFGNCVKIKKYPKIIIGKINKDNNITNFISFLKLYKIVSVLFSEYKDEIYENFKLLFKHKNAVINNNKEFVIPYCPTSIIVKFLFIINW
jgi:hypothetical protein